MLLTRGASANYLKIYNLNWFWYGSNSQGIQTDAPLESAHLHLYNLVPNVPFYAESKFNALQSKANMPLNVYDGYLYDITWVIAKSVYQARSKKGTDVIAVLPYVSNSYFGVTGYCILNKNGDRSKPFYDFFGFKISWPRPNPLQSTLVKYGYSDYLYGIIRWYRTW
jgi:ABC-type branched-subunit amino acid transport system substrate-binding protein